MARISVENNNKNSNDVIFGYRKMSMLDWHVLNDENKAVATTAKELDEDTRNAIRKSTTSFLVGRGYARGEAMQIVNGILQDR
ncbi:MAG: hypothetical protein ACLTBR_03280 [Anaerostipes sp.]|uniref:hypothetical protein n=1 Tax=Anaerostipes sp. TaxID=1872530 RepID=UPI003993E487